MAAVHHLPSCAQIFRIMLFVGAQLFAAMIYSLQTPFYPAEAEKKGLTTLEYGIVFGSYEIFGFLYSPILDKRGFTFPRRTVLFLGLIMLGTSTCSFGFLDRVNGRWEFFGLSILVRLAEAIGATTVVITSKSAVFEEFPTCTATSAAVMETVSGVGMSIGPTMGGLLLQLGGFPLPFQVFGLAVLVFAVVALCLLPTPKPKVPSAAENVNQTERRPHILSLLKVHSIRLGYFTILLGNLGYMGELAILEPYVRNFGLSPVGVGLLFFACAGTYAVFCLGWGALCDRITRINLVTLFGIFASGLGYSCTGPLSNVGEEPLLSVVALGQVLMAIGGSAMTMSSILRITRGIKQEYPGADFAYEMTSGLIFSSYAVGCLLGPIVVGVIALYLPLVWVFYFFIAEHLLLMIPYVFDLTFGAEPTTGEAASLIKTDKSVRYS